MERQELLQRYELLGVEEDFREARLQYEQALAEGPDAQSLLGYGYLLECHGRNELRSAIAQYKRALELDPSADKVHYQLITAQAALGDTDEMLALYRRRVAASPGDVREYRFLAIACVSANKHAEAREAVETGLALAPDDGTLIATRGEVKAAKGDPDGALTDWQRALELDAEDIGPLYSTAFLLEREGRLKAAMAAWRSILQWEERDGNRLAAEWPKRELQRLSEALAGERWEP